MQQEEVAPESSRIRRVGRARSRVSEVLGHATIAVTKDVYGHLLEGDKQAAAESMSRALFGG